MGMKKQVIIFIAPPGAGKGTQSDVLSRKFGFFHLETSRVLEDQLINQGDSTDPEIVEARRLYWAGELITPSLVAKLVIKEIEELHKEGKSIVFSGSFRTSEEATKEIPIVERLYGKENIKIFNITLSEGESIKRNSNRRVCEKSRHPIPNLPKYKDLTECPWDGSAIIKRPLDKSEVIKERYRIYGRDTKPVLNYIKDQDYDIITIHGEQTIEKVSEDILKHFKDDSS